MTLNLFTDDTAPAEHHFGAFAHIPCSLVAESVPFSQATTTMYGKTFQVPRLEAWFGLNPYTYGGQTQKPKPWPDVLHQVCDGVEMLTGQTFDSCFANLYRGGEDTIGWHADDDDWIGPWIASVSFGVPRDFVMRRKADPSDKVTFRLGHGDLLVMPPGTQQRWEHSVPRRKNATGERVNLTFRQTIGAHPLHKGPNGRGVAS